MSTWRVTHINRRCKRHVLVLEAASSKAADAAATRLYGPARLCMCINLSRTRG